MVFGSNCSKTIQMRALKSCHAPFLHFPVTSSCLGVNAAHLTDRSAAAQSCRIHHDPFAFSSPRIGVSSTHLTIGSVVT